jgi:uncharacterized protein YndB with AHSA1/START domain
MSTTLVSPSITDILKVTHRFRAPREKVFAAFSSIEAMKGWFGCGGHISGSVDFRIGGHYRLKSESEGCSTVAIGEYQEITPPEKLVFTWKWENDEDWADVESLITIEFVEENSQTVLTLTQVGFPSEESRSKHTQGWEGCFAKLENYLG